MLVGCGVYGPPLPVIKSHLLTRLPGTDGRGTLSALRGRFRQQPSQRNDWLTGVKVIRTLIVMHAAGAMVSVDVKPSVSFLSGDMPALDVWVLFYCCQSSLPFLLDRLSVSVSSLLQ